MSSDSSDTAPVKDCPFCGETIKAVAIRCRYCHADLTTLATTLSPPVPSAAAGPIPAPAVPAVPAPPTARTPDIAAVPLTPAQTAVATATDSVLLQTAQVLDLLTHLVDRNLVVFEENERGQGRYRLLETVRQYARERLAEDGDSAVEAVRRCHLRHFLALAEEAKAKLGGPQQAAWLDTLESEHDNLRAALEWCLEDEEEGAQRNGVSSVEGGLRLSAALWGFWQTRGHFSEGRQRYAAALSRPGAAAKAWTKSRADALNGAGNLARTQGDFAAARFLLEESLALRREIGDKGGMARSLNNLGIVAMDQGDYAWARSLYQEALALNQESGNRAQEANNLGNLGSVAVGQGDYAAARALFEEALALNRQIGNRTSEAINLNNLGIVARRQGDTAWARALHEESLAIGKALGNKHGMAAALVNLGPLACQEGDYAASRDCLAQCLRLCLALGQKHLTASALEGLALLAQAQEQPERAVRLYGASEALRGAIGSPLPPVEREDVDRPLAALRATLGEAAFTSAWAAGRALPWEQAIAFALEQGHPPEAARAEAGAVGVA